MSIADIRNNGLNPLSYLGVQSYSPLNFIKKTFDPTSNDSQNFTLGTVWLNTAASPQRAWMLVSLSQGVATWVLFVSGVGEVTTLHTQDGNNVTPTAGVINISGGNNITTTGTNGPNTVTISLSGITQHSVQIGGASNALTQLANGTTGQVLTAQTGADPIWASISADGAVTTLHTQDGNNVTPTAGVINISGGNNLTTTGTSGPNTATISLTGITQHSLQVGGASNALTQLGVATNGQIPIGSTGANPVLSTLTAGSGISITNGAGTITISTTGGPGVVNNILVNVKITSSDASPTFVPVFPLAFTTSATAAGCTNTFPIAGTLSGLSVDIASNGSSTNDTLTFYKNGVATALSITFTAGIGGSYIDTTHTVSIAQGDTGYYQISQSATSTINFNEIAVVFAA